jgi:hypothetical protein
MQSLVNPHTPGKSFTTRAFLLLLMTAVLLTYPSLSSGNPVNEEQQRLESGINTHRINIRRLQQGIRLKQEEMEQSLSHEKNVLAELENIDVRLQEHKEKLMVLQERMATQQELIAAKEKELARIKADKHAVQVHLQQRLSA